MTVLAAAAVCTSRARLGASVFILGHRHPVVMAKMLTSIDALSNGRLICGVGVGWWKEELEILGVPFHARGRHGDEILRAFKALWTEDNPRLDGEFFRFRDLGFAPKPVQKPHPPIWVGGDSPGAFRRVVTLGDGWHATSKDPDQLRRGPRPAARGRGPAPARHEDDRALGALQPERRDAGQGRPDGDRPARRVQAHRPEPRPDRLPPRRPRQDARAARPGYYHHPPRSRRSGQAYIPTFHRQSRPPRRRMSECKT